MAQNSGFWDTDGTGDGAAAYTETEWYVLFRALFLSDPTNEGVLKNYLNGLAVSGVSSPLGVATGGALVAGLWYVNDAATTIAVPTPSGATRIDRIVLQADWTAQTVRVARVAGAEGGAAPALTQTLNTKWEVSLAQASITTGGVITVTDERTYAHFNTEVEAVMLADDAVTNAKVADDAINTAQIVDDAVTNAKLADDAVDTAQIVDDAVTNAKLADDAADTAEIADAAVETAQLADDAVTNAKLANMTRGTVKVGGTADAPTDVDAKTSGRILVGDGTDLLSVAVSGDVTLAANGAVTIANDAVETVMIADGNVTQAKLGTDTLQQLFIPLTSHTDGYGLTGADFTVLETSANHRVRLTKESLPANCTIKLAAYLDPGVYIVELYFGLSTSAPIAASTCRYTSSGVSLKTSNDFFADLTSGVQTYQLLYAKTGNANLYGAWLLIEW